MAEVYTDRVPQLPTWPLSETNAEQEVFQRKLLGYSGQHGEGKQHLIMNPFSENGAAGLERDRDSIRDL